MEDCSDSIANTLDLWQSCTKPSIWMLAFSMWVRFCQIKLVILNESCEQQMWFGITNSHGYQKTYSCPSCFYEYPTVFRNVVRIIEVGVIFTRDVLSAWLKQRASAHTQVKPKRYQSGFLEHVERYCSQFRLLCWEAPCVYWTALWYDSTNCADKNLWKNVTTRCHFY